MRPDAEPLLISDHDGAMRPDAEPLLIGDHDGAMRPNAEAPLGRPDIGALPTATLTTHAFATGGNNNMNQNSMAHSKPNDMANSKSNRMGNSNPLQLEVVLQGEPKSGTTWVEMIVEGLFEAAYQGCKDSGCHLTGNLTAVSKGDMRTLTHMANNQAFLNGSTVGSIVWIRRQKHQFPLANTWIKYPVSGSGKSVIPATQGYQRCHKWYMDHQWNPAAKCPFMAAPSFSANRRFVVIVRDPRAVMVSAAHYFHKDAATWTHDRWRAYITANGGELIVAGWVRLNWSLTVPSAHSTK